MISDSGEQVTWRWLLRVRRVCNQCQRPYAVARQNNDGFKIEYCSKLCYRQAQSSRRVPQLLAPPQIPGVHGRYRPGASGEFLLPERVLWRDKARRRKSELVQYKGGVCLNCDHHFPDCCFHFDHRDQSTKSFELSSSWSRSLKALKLEADKCDLVCANCHAIRTHGNEDVALAIHRGRRAKAVA